MLANIYIGLISTYISIFQFINFLWFQVWYHDIKIIYDMYEIKSLIKLCQFPHYNCFEHQLDKIVQP